jgi:2-methylisocitrate lyase-like PEP mutase family enzyme
VRSTSIKASSASDQAWAAGVAYPTAMPPGVPVNVAYLPGGPSLTELGKAGVARISFGPGLFRILHGRLEAALRTIAAGGDPYSR